MAKKEGIKMAFLEFAAEEAVLMRNNKSVVGKSDMKVHFKNQSAKNTNVSLTWQPDFIDVSLAGDLGYTYGEYIYSFTNSEGNFIKNKGIFHTVKTRK